MIANAGILHLGSIIDSMLTAVLLNGLILTSSF